MARFNTNPKTESQLRKALFELKRDVNDTISDYASADSTFGTDDVLIASDGTARGVKATGIDKDTVVVAAANYGTDNRVVRSDGTDHGTQVSSASIADDGTLTLLDDSSLSNVLIAAVDGSSNNTFEVRTYARADQNLAVGRDAGNALTSAAQNNAFFGFDAGGAVTSGDQNTCIGASAGSAINTGAGNVCLGQTAGVGITTGSSNMCIGFNTGFSIGAGILNVFVGSNSGTGTSDTHNVGIGPGSFQTATGGHNVCIGAAAGKSFAGSGSTYNVFIGPSAGSVADTSQLSTASNAIAIGRNCFTAASNQAVLGADTITSTVLRGDVEIARNTNACSLAVYNTAAADPPGTSFEALVVWWDSDVATIETQAGAGGGTDRNLALGTASTPRLTLNSDGTITLNTVGNLPTSEPASGTPGVLWIDASDSNSAILKVTTS